MTIAEARKKVIEILKESAERDMTVTEESRLLQDLELSSMEMVIVLYDLEAFFGIKFKMRKLRHLKTVGDLCDAVIGELL